MEKSMVKPLINTGLVLLGGLGVGYVAGYLITKKSLEKQTDALIQEEIDSVKEFYERQKADTVVKKATPQETFAEIHGSEELGEIIEAYRTTSPIEDKVDLSILVDEDGKSLKRLATTFPVEELRTVNIFKESEENPVTDEELGEEVDGPLEVLDASKPYVIALDDFMDDENGYDKITIAYYEEDESLADDREQLVPDIEGTVGSINLHKFGHKSKNPDIVYVRNERIKTDFEITRDEGSYARNVLGFEPVNSPTRRPTRMPPAGAGDD